MYPVLIEPRGIVRDVFALASRSRDPMKAPVIDFWTRELKTQQRVRRKLLADMDIAKEAKSKMLLDRVFPQVDENPGTWRFKSQTIRLYGFKHSDNHIYLSHPTIKKQWETDGSDKKSVDRARRLFVAGRRWNGRDRWKPII